MYENTPKQLKASYLSVSVTTTHYSFLWTSPLSAPILFVI